MITELRFDRRGNIADLHREQRVTERAREVLLLDALEVRAAPLDPQHPHLAAPVVALDALEGRVAAAPDHERCLGADEARRVDEEIQIGQVPGSGIVPA